MRVMTPVVAREGKPTERTNEMELGFSGHPASKS